MGEHRPGPGRRRLYDLWFHLGTRTGRTTRAYIDGLDPAQGMACLHQPGRGTAWIQQTGHLHHVGDQAVADALIALVDHWVEVGWPSIADHYAILERASDDELALYPVEWHLRKDR